MNMLITDALLAQLYADMKWTIELLQLSSGIRVLMEKILLLSFMFIWCFLISEWIYNVALPLINSLIFVEFIVVTMLITWNIFIYYFRV